MSKRAEPPFLCFELGERDTAIALKNGAGIGEQLSLTGCALHLGNTFRKRLKAAVLVIVRSFFDPKD
jgi:hypothetical protein